MGPDMGLGGKTVWFYSHHRASVWSRMSIWQGSDSLAVILTWMTEEAFVEIWSNTMEAFGFCRLVCSTECYFNVLFTSETRQSVFLNK